LSEASGILKQSFAAKSQYSEKLARETVEKEKAQEGVAEAERYMVEVEAELERVMIENARLKKMLGERKDKISALGSEVARLEIAKEEAEAELNLNFDQTLELLKQSFLQAVRLAHVLYGGPLTSGAFDIDSEVYDVRINGINKRGGELFVKIFAKIE